MSVSSETYVILGVNRIADYGADSGWYERYESIMFDPHTVKIGDRGLLFDGMNTDYALFGQVLALGTEYDAMPLTQIKLADLIAPTADVLEWLDSHKVSGKPDLFIVTHLH